MSSNDKPSTTAAAGPALSEGLGAWQPIETAPRDGRTFLAGRFVEEDEEPDYEVGRYLPLEFPRYKPAGIQGLYRMEMETVHEWDGFNNFARMTHWADLPQAPNVRANAVSRKTPNVRGEA